MSVPFTYEQLQLQLEERFQALVADYIARIDALHARAEGLQSRAHDIAQLRRFLNEGSSANKATSITEMDEREAELKSQASKINAGLEAKVGFFVRKKLRDTDKKKAQTLQEQLNLVKRELSSIEYASWAMKRLGLSPPLTADIVDRLQKEHEADIKRFNQEDAAIVSDCYAAKEKFPVISTSPADTLVLRPVPVVVQERTDGSWQVYAGGKSHPILRWNGGGKNDGSFGWRSGGWGHAWPESDPVECGREGIWDHFSFGYGKKHGHKFLILRRLVNQSNRGGYPAVVLFDPGPEIWNKAKNNAALILRNIMADPVVRDELLNGIETTQERNLRNVIMSRLEQSCWADPLPSMTVSEANRFFGSVLSSVQEPSVHQLAVAIHALPPEKREEHTFMIRGNRAFAEVFGINENNIWDVRNSWPSSEPPRPASTSPSNRSTSPGQR